MKTRFNEFIKLNENNSLISLIDVENVIQKVFNDSKVHSVKDVYEKNGDDLNLIVSINNLFFEECNILHTKLMFHVDSEKSKLITNKFKYLYDLNCQYNEVNFGDIIQMESKMNEIIGNKDFGETLTDISNIYITMATDINKRLEEESMYETSIYNVDYSPLTDIVPCDSFSFDFKLNINNTDELKMNIKKRSSSEFMYTFTHKDWNEEIIKSDIKGTVDTVVEILKKYIK